MKKELVVKDNALINASYHLSLVEQRLILLAIIEARETHTEIDANTKLRISAKSYMQKFHVDKHAAYEGLKHAAASLFGRQFSYWTVDKGTGKQKKVTSRWLQSVAYIDDAATLELVFTMEVVPLITKLEKKFTSYQLEQVSHLTSAYAIRLYELIICWRSQGRTPIIELQDFRNRVGVLEGEHTRSDNFKKVVLDVAIKQINSHTDLIATYTQHKAGRVITGFSFTFKKGEKHKAAAKDKAKKLAGKRESFRNLLKQSGVAL